MTRKDAVKILILSPFYFTFKLSDRKEMIKEFCQIHGTKKETN